MTYKIPEEMAHACELAEEFNLSQSEWVAGRKLMLGMGYMAPCLRNGVLELSWISPEYSHTKEAEWSVSHISMTGHSQRGKTPASACARLALYLTGQSVTAGQQVMELMP